ELILADLETIQKRLGELEKKARSQDKEAAVKRDLVQRVQTWIEQENLVIDMILKPEERALIKDLHLLTNKPFMYAVNMSEGDIGKADVQQLRQTLGVGPSAKIIPVSARVEQELNDLSPDEAQVFLEDLGLKESTLNALIREGFELLGLQTYFTAGVKEVRAWTIHKGWTAPKAAGVIHTDFEKGFIRAEICAWQDFVALGGESKCRDVGKLRSEGKEYVMRDGDVVHFLFNNGPFLAIGAERDGPQIFRIDPGSCHLIKAEYRFEVRVIELIISTRCDDDLFSQDRIQEWLGVAGYRTMMACFVDIGCQVEVRHEQFVFRIFFNVPSEEHRALPIDELEDNRSIVHIVHFPHGHGMNRVEHVQVDPCIDPPIHAGIYEYHFRRVVLQKSQKSLIERGAVHNAGHHHTINLVSLKHFHQTLQMVQIRVREQHEVNLLQPKARLLSEALENRSPRSAVNENGSPIRRCNKDAVALADIEKFHAEVRGQCPDMVGVETEEQSDENWQIIKILTVITHCSWIHFFKNAFPIMLTTQSIIWSTIFCLPIKNSTR
ncbi:MAG: DUF933 domain-containing protein, partial [Candidatus Gracilibacteria bacterium]|nr:DUF933 domain-containing protein [Candidatus Gracilibacteria bacterium]